MKLPLRISANQTAARQLLDRVCSANDAWEWLKANACVELPDSPDTHSVVWERGPAVPGPESNAHLWMDTATGCVGVRSDQGWVQHIGVGALVLWAPESEPDHVRRNERLRKLTQQELDAYGLKGDWGFVTGIKREGVIYK